jgi:hypothetical protein
MTARATRWVKSLVAVLLGNGLYFSLLPYLPPAARHQPLELDVGVLVDFWFCLFVYGLLEAGAQIDRWWRQRP